MVGAKDQGTYIEELDDRYKVRLEYNFATLEIQIVYPLLYAWHFCWHKPSNLLPKLRALIFY